MSHEHVGECCGCSHAHQEANLVLDPQELVRTPGNACCAGACQHPEHAIMSEAYAHLISQLFGQPSESVFGQSLEAEDDNEGEKDEDGTKAKRRKNSGRRKLNIIRGAA